jgi:hypothetical protein
VNLCDGERFEVQAPDGWLMNGKRVPMYLALRHRHPALRAIRQSLDAVSDEGMPPFASKSLAFSFWLARSWISSATSARENAG